MESLGCFFEYLSSGLLPCADVDEGQLHEAIRSDEAAADPRAAAAQAVEAELAVNSAQQAVVFAEARLRKVKEDLVSGWLGLGRQSSN